MSFDWSEYLTLAKRLAGEDSDRPSEESRLRAAISRAYYAAFCKARNYLRDQDRDPDIPNAIDPDAYNGAIHGKVIHKFRNNKVNKDRRQIGENLNNLRKERNKADYDDVYQTQQDLLIITRTALSWANHIISKLESLTPNPRRK